MRLVKSNVNIDFMGKRKLALGLSALLMAAALVVLPTMGLNFGLDFTGGTEVEMRFSEAPEIADVRASLENAGMADATVQNFGSSVDLLVRIPPHEGEGEGEAAWTDSAAQDDQVVSSMRRGAKAVITGVSSRGTTTVDTFSLLGFTAAVEEAARRCGG